MLWFNFKQDPLDQLQPSREMILYLECDLEVRQVARLFILLHQPILPDSLTLPYVSCLHHCTQLAKALQPYGLKWIEECLQPDDYHGQLGCHLSPFSLLLLLLLLFLFFFLLFFLQPYLLSSFFSSTSFSSSFTTAFSSPSLVSRPSFPCFEERIWKRGYSSSSPFPFLFLFLYI